LRAAERNPRSVFNENSIRQVQGGIAMPKEAAALVCVHGMLPAAGQDRPGKGGQGPSNALQQLWGEVQTPCHCVGYHDGA